MRIVARICLYLLIGLCLALAGYVLHGHREKETWATIAGLLAVIAASVAALPALRVVELQEDALRPMPTPHFDLTSRYFLLQLRVKNLGAGAAYDVELHWKTSAPYDAEGEEVRVLDRIAVLLPQESVSILLGTSNDMVSKFGDRRFEGECRY